MSTGSITKSMARESLKNNWAMAIALMLTLFAALIFSSVVEQLVRLLLNIPATIITEQNIAGETREAVVANPSIYSTLITMVFVLFRLFFFLPLTLGQCLWHFNNAEGNQTNEMSVLFAPYSSPKSLFKTVWFLFNIEVRRTLWAFAFFIPLTITLFPIVLIIMTAQLFDSDTIVLAIVLFTTAYVIVFLILYSIFIMRYLLAPYLIISNPYLSARQAIKLSIKIMKGRETEAFWFHLSFIGWFLLCIFILPVFYVLPLFFNSRAHYARRLIEESGQKEFPKAKDFTREFSPQGYQTV